MGLVALVLAMFAGVILPVTPAHAAWGKKIPVTIQINYPNGGSPTLGRVEGWIQFDGADSFRYSFTFCRQSSYSPPSLTISVNRTNYGALGWKATEIERITPWYLNPPINQVCYGMTDTASGQHTYPGLRDVYLVLQSGTFIGYTFTTFTQDRWVWEEV